MKDKKIISIILLITFLISLIVVGGIYIFKYKFYFNTQNEEVIKDFFPIDSDKTKIEIPEGLIYTVYNGQSKNRINVIVENFYSLNDNNGDLIEGNYGIKVVFQNNKNEEKTLFEYGDALGAHVGNIEFSPDGRFVSFDVSFYEGDTDYLFDLDSLVNLNESRILNAQSIKWADDSSYAIIENSYSEYTGEGQDGTFKFDATTKKIEKVK